MTAFVRPVLFAAAFVAATSVTRAQSVAPCDPDDPARDGPPFAGLVVTTRVTRPGTELAVERYLRALRDAVPASSGETLVYDVTEGGVTTYVSMRAFNRTSALSLADTDAIAMMTRVVGQEQAMVFDRDLQAATTSLTTEIHEVRPGRNYWPSGELYAFLEVRRRLHGQDAMPHTCPQPAPGGAGPRTELHSVVHHAEGDSHSVARGFLSVEHWNAWLAHTGEGLEPADQVQLLRFRSDLSRPAWHFDAPATGAAPSSR